VTDSVQTTDDRSERVNNVLARADALSNELRRTITELTQMLRAEGEVAANARRSTK
jgi:hypothetical protein